MHVRKLHYLLVLGSTDSEDRLGYRFYGNFYLALYHDSIGEDDALVSALVVCNYCAFRRPGHGSSLPRVSLYE